MKLKFLCDAAGICCPDVYFEREIEDICTDSRKEMKNAMFVCFQGTKYDSHNYIQDAIQHGAVCILTDRNHPQITQKEGIAFLQCDDPRASLAHLWNAWYDFPCRNLKIIGVTGTNGKTSVAHMLRTILRTSWHTCGIIGAVDVKRKKGLSNLLPKRNFPI